MPRVKKKSIEYGNRKRRKLAAAKRSVVYNQPLKWEDGDQNAARMTERIMLPNLSKSDTENDLKYQDIRSRKIENLNSKQNILNTAGIKVKKDEKEEYKPIRPIKGLSEMLSKSVITAEDAAAAVTAVTSKASLKQVLAGHKAKIPKQPKLQKQTSVKVSLPPPKTSTPVTTPANPGKLMVNFKGLGNSPSSSGNTQKAYALYVGGQLKYILPYNGPLGAISNTQQQNNEMKKLICRGVNGKTEIALAKPTVVCDDEKKKIVFVVQKKATAAAGPADSLLSKNNQNSERKLLKIPTLASLSASGQSFQGNQVISDNMLRLLLLPAVSANANSNNPTTPPATISSNGQAQKARTSTPKITLAPKPPVTKTSTSSSIPVVVKLQSQSVSSAMTTPTTTTAATPITVATTTTTTTTSSIPTLTTTTDTTNNKSQTSPVSSSATSPTSVRPVQLFTRDSALKLCPAPPILAPGKKPCMAILDPSDPEANIRPGKSLLTNSEPAQIVSKQGTAGVRQIIVKKTSADTSVILQLKDAAGVSSVISPSDKNNKLSDPPTKANQHDPSPHTALPVSLPSSDKTETMTDISAPACVEEENANNNNDGENNNNNDDDDDDDGGMFGLKISSVFSLAENQPCSPAGEAAMDQEIKLINDASPESFKQDPIPADTLATAMKLSVTSEELTSNNETDNEGTVFVSLEPDNKSSRSPEEDMQIGLDTSQNKATNIEKSSVAKSMTDVEQQTLSSLEPDLEDEASVIPQTNHSQKENDSPKKASPFMGSEKDFLAGQKYITVDIFRHNGQTKITAVSNSGKKEITSPVCTPDGDGASGSSSNDTKSPSSSPDTRLNEVLQCAAYSLPMGTYFFIPLPDKTVAIPSQRHKKNRSAYVFEKNHNFMQVKMAKYMIFNSKDKLPSFALANTNSSQLVCQISNPSKTNEEPSIILPVSPVKDPVPILEAPPIVTGKRIRRPKKLTGFEEDMNMIPPLRKYRKSLKSVKAEKNAKVQTKTEKNPHNVTTNQKGKNTGLDSSSSSNNKLLQPVDSKDEVAAVLRSVNIPLATSNNSNANSLPYVFVSPPGTKISSVSKSVTPASSTSEVISQDSNQSGLHIDSVQSLQPEAIKIKSEPITSGYGDEPVKDLPPLLEPASSVQIGQDALGMPHTIKKEPSWYGYETHLSSTKLLSSLNTTTSTSQSDYMNPSSINMNPAATYSKQSYDPDTPQTSLYKRDSSTDLPTGKKRGRKKKETDEVKPEVKKRKYVRHKTETPSPVTAAAAANSLMSTFSSVFPLKSEVKLEPLEPSQSSQGGETPQEERIRRLKEILREKEQKLEEIRHNLSVSTQNVG